MSHSSHYLHQNSGFVGRRCIFTFCILILSCAAATAQAPLPDIATPQLLRQQERLDQLRETLDPTPALPPPSLPPPADALLPTGEQPCSFLRRLVLDGPKAEHFDWLPDAAAGPQGADSPLFRCVGAGGIDRVLQRMQQALVRRGYPTTRVTATTQDLGSGTLHITLVPGTVQAVRAAADSSPRGAFWNALPTRAGDLLRLPDIDQGLEVLKRLPSAQAEIEIVPAAGPDGRPGQSDLLVHYQQSSPLRVNLALDDGGTRATGKRQGSVTISYDNGLLPNDLAYLNLGRDIGRRLTGGEHGTRAYTLHYSVPYGYWLFGATASHNRYFQQVAGASQTYLYSGDSDTAELRASRVVWRDGAGRTTASVRAFRRSAANFIDDTEIEVQHRVTAGWEASLAHRHYLGEGTLDASLAYRHGTGAFGAQPAPEEPFGEGTSRMRLAIGELAYSRPFTAAGQRLRYAGTWHAQWNRTPLTPQDRLAIGGRYSVRGFDGESFLLAERGWYWRNDLSVAAGTGQEAYLGLDTGRVGGPSAAGLLGQALTGSVLGLRGSWKSLSYDVFVGMPLAKPDGFRTAGTTAGFNLGYGF